MTNITFDIEETESAFAQTTIPTNIHTANKIFTNIILMANKHSIPKSKMHRSSLSDHKVCKITQINSMWIANTCDPALKLLNEEITSDIHKGKQNLWKEHLDAQYETNCAFRFHPWKSLYSSDFQNFHKGGAL